MGECVDDDCGGEGADVVCWGVGIKERIGSNSRGEGAEEVAMVSSQRLKSASTDKSHWTTILTPA